MTLPDLTSNLFSTGSPKDLAEELGSDGKMAILKIICKAYTNLCVPGRLISNRSEIEITEELFIELQVEWKRADISLIPVHEKPHGKRKKGKGNTPTIDFCFRHRLDSFSYFGAECKLLAENDNTLYNLYITKGMNRYISGKYGEKCFSGLMLGYIILGDATEVVNELKNKVDKLPNISNMTLADPINGFDKHYNSTHKRDVGLSPFHIHHLFFSFA